MMLDPVPALPAGPTARPTAIVELPAQRVSPLALRSLIAAYRTHGHRIASIDPIGVWSRDLGALHELEPGRHGIPGIAAADCVVELGGQSRGGAHGAREAGQRATRRP